MILTKREKALIKIRGKINNFDHRMYSDNEMREIGKLAEFLVPLPKK